MLNRPKITCNILSSINGKIIPDDLNDKKIIFAKKWYEEIMAEEFSSFLCDKEKMEEKFTKGFYPNLESFKDTDIQYEDFITHEDGKNFAIAMDPQGEIGWRECEIDDQRLSYNGKPIIEIVTKKASKEYLAYLRSINVNYLICGEKEIDLKLALNKLYHTYGIKKIFLEASASTNNLFIEDDVIDTIGLMIIPCVLGSNSEPIFNSSEINNFELDYTSSKKDITYIKYYKNTNSTYNAKVGNKELNHIIKIENEIIKNSKKLSLSFQQAIDILKLVPSKINYTKINNDSNIFSYIECEKDLIHPVFLKYLPIISNVNHADYKNILARKLIVVLDKKYNHLNFVQKQYLDRFSDEKFQILTTLEFIQIQLNLLDINNPKTEKQNEFFHVLKENNMTLNDVFIDKIIVSPYINNLLENNLKDYNILTNCFLKVLHRNERYKKIKEQNAPNLLIEFELTMLQDALNNYYELLYELTGL